MENTAHFYKEYQISPILLRGGSTAVSSDTALRTSASNEKWEGAVVVINVFEKEVTFQYVNADKLYAQGSY